MRKTKKFLAILLSICMLISVTTSVSFNAFATSKTADEAISWVKGQLGKTVGSGQCVALINSYYSFLGVSPVSGNGCDYSSNSLPSGWTRTKGGTPQKGDILVYNANSSNPYGHVGIYEGDYSHYHQNVNGQYVECITGWKYNGFTNSYWGCIHPNFSGSLGKATGLKVKVTGGLLQLSWNAANGANCYDVIVTNPSGGVDYYHASGTSKDFRGLSYGVYKFDVQSLYRPNGSSSGQTVGPHSDVLTYDFNMQSPANVKINRTGTTIEVTWDAADGANCYDVIVKDPKGSTNWYHTGIASKTFTDCIPGNYVYDVQSLYRPNGSSTGQKVGPHSGEYPYTFALEGPKNLKVSNDKDDNLVIEWDKVDGATCYDVIVKKPNGNTDYLHSHDNVKVISNYDFGEYEIDVQSLYRENEGTSSQFQVVGNHSQKITYNYKKSVHNHTLVTVEAVEPTCEKDGATQKVYCSECNEVLQEQTVIPKLGHDYLERITKEASCKENGTITHTCSRCGKSYDTDIEKTEHSYIGTVLSRATCEKDGTMKYTCEVCGDQYTEPIFATGHEYDSVITPPTCTDMGYTTYFCRLCGDNYKTNYVQPKGHTEVADKAVAPTCTEKGKTEGSHCSVCNKVIVAQTAIAALGHEWDSGTITKKATPTATGVKTFTCSVCDATKTESIAKSDKYANPLTVKGKTATVKFTKLKKKNQTVAQKNIFTVSKAQGKVTYKKSSGNKKITINSSGKITVKKGLKKGTYKVKIKVTAAGNATYKSSNKTVTVTIKIK